MSMIYAHTLYNMREPWAYVRDAQSLPQGSYTRHVDPSRDPQVMRQLNQALKEGYVHKWYEMLLKHPCTVPELGKVKNVNCIYRYCLLLDNYLEVYVQSSMRTYDGTVDEMTVAEIAARREYGLLGGLALIKVDSRGKTIRNKYVGLLGADYAR